MIRFSPRNLKLRFAQLCTALRSTHQVRNPASQGCVVLLRVRLLWKDLQIGTKRHNWRVDEQALFSWKICNFNLPTNSQGATCDVEGQALRLPIWCPMRLPYNGKHAHFFRERISVWRRFCLASGAGACRTIKSSALYSET